MTAELISKPESVELKPLHRPRLPELSYLNVLFILMVICVHILSEPIISLDRLSVQYFVVYTPWKLFQFVTQGFIFLSGLKLFINNRGEFKIGRFYLSRAKRVLLPYFVWVIVYYAYFVSINWLNFSFSELAHYIIFGDLASHFYFVIIIIQFYLLTPLFSRIFKKCTPWLATVYSFFISLILGEFLPQLLTFISPDISFAYNDRLFTTYLFYFIAGAALGMNYSSVIAGLRKAKVSVYSAFAAFTALNLALSYLTSCGKIYIHWGYSLHFAYSVSAILAALTFAVGFAEKHPALPRSVKLADSSSYMLYLSHILIIFIVRRFLDGKVVDIGVRLAATLAVLALYVVLSVVLWSFVKEKMRHTRT